ncbi:MAG: hypothetical protein ABIZ05_08980 [Pseudonocardiaceae bacterium]
MPVGTNTTSARRMPAGGQPRWPVPRLAVKVLSRALHHEISVTECGFAGCTPAADDQYDGVSCAGTLRTVVELSVRDLHRRKFLVSSAFSGAATGRRRGTSRRPERNHLATACGKGAELQRGKQIVTLEIRVVGEDVLDRHARGQQLEQVLDGVSKTSNGRLAVTHRRVRSGSI